MKDVEQMQKEILEECKKHNKAMVLNKQLKSVWLGFLNPKYWKIRKELESVVKTFRNKDVRYFNRFK